MLIKLPDGNWVNPRHVTCVDVGRPHEDLLTYVSVDHGRGGSYRFVFKGDLRDKLAALINAGEEVCNAETG